MPHITNSVETGRGEVLQWTQAVNAHGGRWRWEVAHHPGEIRDILKQAQEARAEGSSRTAQPDIEQRDPQRYAER